MAGNGLGQQIEKIQNLGETLLQVSGVQGFKQLLRRELEELFDAEDSLFLDWRPITSGDRHWAGDDMLFQEQLSDVIRRYYEIYHEDPVYQWAISDDCPRDHNVIRYSDLLDFGQFRKSRFYQELIRPTGYRYVLSIVFRKGDEVIGNISLMRRQGSRDFNQSDLRLARAIASMINATYQNLLLTDELSLRGTVFGIVESLHQNKAFLILSRELRTLYRSERGGQLADWIQQQTGTPIYNFFQSSDSLRDYLAVFASSHVAHHRQLPLEISDALPVTDRETLIITLQLFRGENEQPFLLASLDFDAEKKAQSYLQTVYRMTLREIQIAQLACGGLNSRELGEELCISPWSVKNHLKNIYKKTGTHNRSQLARFISRQSG